jgi:hypothetical protein
LGIEIKAAMAAMSCLSLADLQRQSILKPWSDSPEVITEIGGHWILMGHWTKLHTGLLEWFAHSEHMWTLLTTSVRAFCRDEVSMPAGRLMRFPHELGWPSSDGDESVTRWAEKRRTVMFRSHCPKLSKVIPVKVG